MFFFFYFYSDAQWEGNEFYNFHEVGKFFFERIQFLMKFEIIRLYLQNYRNFTPFFCV